MNQFHNIMVVVQDPASARALFGKTAEIAESRSGQTTRIHAVRIVYEGIADISTKEVDESIEMKKFILQSEKDELDQIIAEAASPSLEIKPTVLWNRRLWEGVIHAAQTVSADLIIKTTQDSGRRIIRTPDDWNILRESNVPVFLMHSNNWRASPIIIAAIDALDQSHNKLSERVLARASALAQQLSGDLHICSCYPLFEPWSTRIGLLQSYKKLRKELERDIAVSVNQLMRTIGAPDYKLHCIEGTPELGLEELAKDIAADILVIGHHARDGIEAAFIGNTAEKILHQTQIDVLTIR